MSTSRLVITIRMHYVHMCAYVSNNTEQVHTERLNLIIKKTEMHLVRVYLWVRSNMHNAVTTGIFL